MRLRIIAALASVAALSACQGLKEALTAHVDVVAKTGSQELSVSRLGSLLGTTAIPVDPTKENAQILAGIWADYQRLAMAAANNDTLVDKIDVALLPIANSAKVRLLIDSLRQSFAVDSGSEAGYNQGKGDIYAARHILWAFPPAATEAQKDSVRKVAAAILPTVNAGNFAAMARRHSKDGSAATGGDLGAFVKSGMVPEFGNATAALQPGQVSGLVESQFGVHIIMRKTWAEASQPGDGQTQSYSQVASESGNRVADSTFQAQLKADADIKVKDNAPTLAKNAIRESWKHRDDKATLATFKGGELTVAEFINWVETLPPQMNAAQQIMSAPDTALTDIIQNFFATQEVLLKRANDAKIEAPKEQMEGLEQGFRQMVTATWQQLGVSPEMLADSAKTTAEKERLAASRVEAFIDGIMAGRANPVQVPNLLKAVLDAKYEMTINSAGIDRAIEAAKSQKAKADSTKSSAQPPTQVPIPGAPPGDTGR